jgi:glycogen synthase
MRILSVTETYAPFLEFGGPPVKVRALAQGLAGHGNEVTVLTADWGLAARLSAEEVAGAERSHSDLLANVVAVPLVELESGGRAILPGTAREF